ncbi:MAG TPA: SET domain-containing protein-lysine N-methyltransferase [Pyrinomonadaceae bacterium]
MTDRKYSLQSWIDPRIEIRPSPIGGKGMFAREPIKKGETVIVWGGAALTKKDLESGNFRKGTLSAIAEHLWLGDPPDGQDYAADYTNHSCDPNLRMEDEVTLAARRDIGAGEELTADYMTWEADESYQAPWRCNCGSPSCRKQIRGGDWKLPELQERYRGHFSPFLNQRIEREKASA